MNSKTISEWAKKHRYKYMHRSKNPDLVIIGESHGVQRYGKVPEFISSQFELIHALKPRIIAVEGQRPEESNSPYPVESDFEAISSDLQSKLIKATVFDLYTDIAERDRAGKLANNNYRKKLAGFISHWPENLYDKTAEEIRAQISYIDHEKANSDSLRLLEENDGQSLGFEDYVRFMFMARVRSLVMQRNLAEFQKNGLETIAVMGSAHAEHILEKPEINMKKTTIINQGDIPEECKRYDGLTDILMESIFDMLDIEQDIGERHERGTLQ